MMRIFSETIFLLFISMLVSCSQPTLPAPTFTSDPEPAPTENVVATVTRTPTNTPTTSFDVSSAPIVGPVDGVIEFAGRTWNVKSGCGLGPGPNCWSDSLESVWVQGGQLHLKIRRIENLWHSAEVATAECSQYGPHRFFISGDVDSLDKNVVAAVFLYNDDQNEIDIEFSKWASENVEENAQYVVQPWDIPGNIHRFAIPQDITESTHIINWDFSSIQFTSSQGHSQEPPSPDALLAEWEYRGNDIPADEDCLKVHINLWQISGSPPSDGQEAVFVVGGAQIPGPYQPPSTPISLTSIPTTGSDDAPSVKVEKADADYVSGLVGPGAYCNDNYRIVIYAKTDIWYVQPFTANPLTTIGPGSCNWESFTHPWNELAVFLVPSNYDPPATLRSQSCPPNLPEVEVLALDCFIP